jgi:hypothetical protein
MVKFIKNNGWTDLTDVTMLSLDDTNDFTTVSYKDEPKAHHVRRFRGFLLYYNRKCCDLSSKLDKDDVMMISKTVFHSYLGSLDYHTDFDLALELIAKRRKERGASDVFIDMTVRHQRVAPFGGELSGKHAGDDPIVAKRVPTINNEDLIGRTFLKETCEIDDDTTNEFLLYNQILDFIEQDSHGMEFGTEQFDFIEHVIEEWETGETKYEAPDLIAKDDPIICTEYSKRNGMVDTPGWKHLKTSAKNDTMIDREPFWKYGYIVPWTHAHAVEIDLHNGNTKWQDSEATEMRQLMKDDTFIDQENGGIVHDGFKWIRFHMIYDVKPDGQHKSRFVAGMHSMDPGTKCNFSGVVLLHGIRLVAFLAELNLLELWGADVGNDYLKDRTKKKGYLLGDPEFGTHNASDFDWDPGSYNNTIDYISKFHDFKEIDNIREWGAMEKLISDWDDGEDHEMMNE